MITVFGIKQCSSMQKAFAWLDAAGIAYEFHDYKKQGATPAQLTQWCGLLGWEALLNTRGTTWRKLPEEARAEMNQARAIQLMSEHTSLIKRPLILGAPEALLGFDAERYAHVLRGL